MAFSHIDHAGLSSQIRVYCRKCIPKCHHSQTPSHYALVSYPLLSDTQPLFTGILSTIIRHSALVSYPLLSDTQPLCTGILPLQSDTQPLFTGILPLQSDTQSLFTCIPSTSQTPSHSALVSYLLQSDTQPLFTGIPSTTVRHPATIHWYPIHYSQTSSHYSLVSYSLQ